MQENKIKDKIKKMRALLTLNEPVLKGSVSAVSLGLKQRSRGQRVAHLLTYKGAGNKTKSLYVRKDHVPEVKRSIQNYKRAKQALETLVELHIDLFKIRRKQPPNA